MACILVRLVLETNLFVAWPCPKFKIFLYSLELQPVSHTWLTVATFGDDEDDPLAMINKEASFQLYDQ